MMINKYLFVTIMFWSCSSSLLAEDRWSVSATEWAQPRSGKMVTTLPGIRAAMAAASRSGVSSMVIHYPGGDQGVWWAEELKGWLTTLGVSSGRVELVPGSGETDMIYLTVVKTPIIEPKQDKAEK